MLRTTQLKVNELSLALENNRIQLTTASEIDQTASQKQLAKSQTTSEANRSMNSLVEKLSELHPERELQKTIDQLKEELTVIRTELDNKDKHISKLTEKQESTEGTPSEYKLPEVFSKIEEFVGKLGEIPPEIERFMSIKKLNTDIRVKSAESIEECSRQLKAQVLMLLRNYRESLNKKQQALLVLKEGILRQIQNTDVYFSKEEVEESLQFIDLKQVFLGKILEEIDALVVEFSSVEKN